MATRIGFSENARIMIVTSVSELSRNIMKYAGTGTILMSPIRKGDQAGMEVVARDRGPGISNIEEAMADHFSSGGTLGLGLPGVRRLMDEFEIESASKLGTQVVCRKWC
jgi:serine/threonine-protein kinase RsbT